MDVTAKKSFYDIDPSCRRQRLRRRWKRGRRRLTATITVSTVNKVNTVNTVNTVNKKATAWGEGSAKVLSLSASENKKMPFPGKATATSYHGHKADLAITRLVLYCCFCFGGQPGTVGWKVSTDPLSIGAAHLYAFYYDSRAQSYKEYYERRFMLCWF